GDQGEDPRVAEEARRGPRGEGPQGAEGGAQPHSPLQARAAQGDGLGGAGGAVNPDNVIDVARLIQLAVAPVFLLTAVGTMIGVLSTRLGRAVDRTRYLEERLARV